MAEFRFRTRNNNEFYNNDGQGELFLKRGAGLVILSSYKVFNN